MNYTNKFVKKGTFIVVFILIVGIILVGFDNTSYALPTYTKNEAPDKIVRIRPLYSYEPVGALSGSVPNFEAKSIDSKKMYKVFCLDRHGNFNTEEELIKKGEVPYPLTYIALNTIPYVNYNTTDATNKTCVDAENIWIGQAAIWKYLDDNKIDNKTPYGNLNLIPEHDIKADSTDIYSFYEDLDKVEKNLRYFKAGDGGSIPDDTTELTGCTKKGNQLWQEAQVLAAEAAKATDLSKNLTFNLSKSKVSKTEDGKSYKTELVKFETLASNNIESYKLEIPNAPKDTKVYDQNSNEITDLNNIAGNRSFYIVIPKTSFSSEKINFNIKVTANFNFVKGYYYEDAADKNQPVMLLGNESTTKTAELVFSDDTALNISNSIYFIGFVILISGAGIIYANVKPRTKESEY